MIAIHIRFYMIVNSFVVEAAKNNIYNKIFYKVIYILNLFCLQLTHVPHKNHWTNYIFVHTFSELQLETWWAKTGEIAPVNTAVSGRHNLKPEVILDIKMEHKKFKNLSTFIWIKLKLFFCNNNSQVLQFWNLNYLCLIPSRVFGASGFSFLRFIISSAGKSMKHLLNEK